MSMNEEILDLAQKLMEKLEEAGYSLVNSAGFKDITIHVWKDYLEVVNYTSNPPIRIEKYFD